MASVTAILLVNAVLIAIHIGTTRCGNAEMYPKEEVLGENEQQDEESNSEIRSVRRADGRPPWKIDRENRLLRAEKHAEEFRNICKTNTAECLSFTRWYTGYLLWLEKQEMRDKRREQVELKAELKKEDHGKATEATTTAPGSPFFGLHGRNIDAKP
ncbi:hypothetical protein Q1695_007373 [Nippostrongylus brasiliensis]|nr:hypothetical protein Q1695_007373 [Nippostrongylus brasiliensis]